MTAILVPEAIAPALTKAIAEFEQLIAEHPDEAREITKNFIRGIEQIPAIMFALEVERGEHPDLPDFVCKEAADLLRYYRGLAGIDKTK
jgi:hypothetical protein